MSTTGTSRRCNASGSRIPMAVPVSSSARVGTTSNGGQLRRTTVTGGNTGSAQKRVGGSSSSLTYGGSAGVAVGSSSTAAIPKRPPSARSLGRVAPTATSVLEKRDILIRRLQSELEIVRQENISLEQKKIALETEIQETAEKINHDSKDIEKYRKQLRKAKASTPASVSSTSPDTPRLAVPSASAGTDGERLAVAEKRGKALHEKLKISTQENSTLQQSFARLETILLRVMKRCLPEVEQGSCGKQSHIASFLDYTEALQERVTKAEMAMVHLSLARADLKGEVERAKTAAVVSTRENDDLSKDTSRPLSRSHMYGARRMPARIEPTDRLANIKKMDDLLEEAARQLANESITDISISQGGQGSIGVHEETGLENFGSDTSDDEDLIDGFADNFVLEIRTEPQKRRRESSGGKSSGSDNINR